MSQAPFASPHDGTRDRDRLTAELAERLPERLRPLARLCFNYAWSWLPGGAGVMRDLRPTLWQRSGCNPRWMIEVLPPTALRALAADPAYVERVQAAGSALDAHLARSASGPVAADRPVAYFCSEFGAHCSLPLYGGGLGVLAGDALKGASDLGLPLVGIGLLYREGYFRQRLDLSGWQHEYWTRTDFERLPLARVSGPDGEALCVELPLRGRRVRIQIWRADIGRVPLFLLDTERSENHPIDRWITARLYIGDRHTRLAQYAVLGIGGMRALAAMGIRPGLVHLNEGHAVLACFERLAALQREGVAAEEALERVRQHTVFTTHTPVAAGNEWYAQHELEPVLAELREELGMPADRFYGLGRSVPQDASEPVHITPLALRTSGAANGVSRRHGQVARQMWHGLWPGRELGDVPITHVTNGVHTPTWMADAMQELLDAHFPKDWRERVDDPSLWDALAGVPDAELWAVRGALRQRLVAFLRERSIHDRLSRGEPPDYVEAAARVFDPETLTLGFARRVATYKRLHLLTRDLQRGLRLLSDGARPIQIVIAGKAHPQDEESKRTLRELLEQRYVPGVGSRIVFLEDYDLHAATRVAAGVDLWLNLPRPPLEASGTSGMKVVLNGALNLSVLDGWWDEAYDGEVGWAIASPDAEHHLQDERDTTALFNLLEHEAIPLFYERGPDGLPRRWLARVRASMARLAPRFSATRMLREYASRLYAGRS